MNANSCIIRGGSVVCADRVLPDHDVVIVDGRIAAIEPVGAHDFDVQPDAALGGSPAPPGPVARSRPRDPEWTRSQRRA